MNSSPRLHPAFTLVELMVSTAIIGLIMLVLVAMTNQMSSTWRGTTEKIEKFQEARDGFESMTRRLSQATLNTYWDYLDSTGTPRVKDVQSALFQNFIPYMYGRASELRFVSGPMHYVPGNQTGVTALAATEGSYGDISTRIRPTHGVFFQAPFGVVNSSDAQANNYGILNNLMNTWGYFVETGYDTTRPAFVDKPNPSGQPIVPKRWRSRLMEYMLPSEQMAVYNTTDTSYKWFSVFLAMDTPNRPVRTLAENVVALVILPKLTNADQDARVQTFGVSVSALSPWYVYDSCPFDANAKPLEPPINPGANAATDLASINPKNQLPPIVSVTMIAIDERSAERLADKYCSTPNQDAPSDSDATMGLSVAAGKVTTSPSINYQNLFANSYRLETDPTTPPTPANPVSGDLFDLERILTNEKVTYRVFTSNVTIRGAKWSRCQTK